MMIYQSQFSNRCSLENTIRGHFQYLKERPANNKFQIKVCKIEKKYYTDNKNYFFFGANMLEAKLKSRPKMGLEVPSELS